MRGGEGRRRGEEERRSRGEGERRGAEKERRRG